VEDAHALRTPSYQALLEPSSPRAKVREAAVISNNPQKGQNLHHTQDYSCRIGAYNDCMSLGEKAQEMVLMGPADRAALLLPPLTSGAAAMPQDMGCVMRKAQMGHCTAHLRVPSYCSDLRILRDVSIRKC